MLRDGEGAEGDACRDKWGLKGRWPIPEQIRKFGVLVDRDSRLGRVYHTHNMRHEHVHAVWTRNTHFTSIPILYLYVLNQLIFQ